MSIKSKIINSLEGPEKANTLEFCKDYIELSERYWTLADQDLLNAINSAMDEAIQNSYTQKESNRFDGMTISEIKKFFHQRRLELFKDISPKTADYIQDLIDEHLKRKRYYAEKCELQIPGREHLSVAQYYLNYEKAKIAARSLGLAVGDKFKR